MLKNSLVPIRSADLALTSEKMIFKLGPLAGAHPRGGPGGPGPPWDLINTIFSGFLPLNSVIYIFEVCILCFLLCGRTEEACSMVNSLREVDFSHPTGHYTWKKNVARPLEKILGAPLSSRNLGLHVMGVGAYLFGEGYPSPMFPSGDNSFTNVSARKMILHQ